MLGARTLSMDPTIAFDWTDSLDWMYPLRKGLCVHPLQTPYLWHQWIATWIFVQWCLGYVCRCQQKSSGGGCLCCRRSCFRDGNTAPNPFHRLLVNPLCRGTREKLASFKATVLFVAEPLNRI